MLKLYCYTNKSKLVLNLLIFIICGNQDIRNLILNFWNAFPSFPPKYPFLTCTISELLGLFPGLVSFLKQGIFTDLRMPPCMHASVLVCSAAVTDDHTLGGL